MSKSYEKGLWRLHNFCQYGEQILWKFRLNEIIPDMFKCLIFIQGLTSSSEKEIRTRLLARLQPDQQKKK